MHSIYELNFVSSLAEISGSISAGVITANKSNSAGVSRLMGPETPENERRNKFGGT